MVMIGHERKSVYIQKHIALSFDGTFLYIIIWCRTGIIEYVHIMDESNIVSVFHKYIPLLNAAIDEVIEVHSPHYNLGHAVS